MADGVREQGVLGICTLGLRYPMLGGGGGEREREKGKERSYVSNHILQHMSKTTHFLSDYILGGVMYCNSG